MRSRATLAFLVALAASAAGGCSSSSSDASGNAPPVIDQLDMPASVAGSTGDYTIRGTISFHDDDDTVTPCA